MELTEEERKEFEELARPIMKFLNEHCTPYVTAQVTVTTANLLEDFCGIGEVMDYVKG